MSSNSDSDSPCEISSDDETEKFMMDSVYPVLPNNPFGTTWRFTVTFLSMQKPRLVRIEPVVEQRDNFCQSTIDQQLRDACCNGNLELAQRLRIQGATNLNEALIGACLNGHIAIAQWLRVQGHYTAKDLYGAFAGACSGGHLIAAQWMQTECKVVPLQVLDFALNFACSNEHGVVEKWLRSQGAQLTMHDKHHLKLVRTKSR